jgi:hypothetical protein
MLESIGCQRTVVPEALPGLCACLPKACARAHQLENIFPVDGNNLRAGGAGLCGADLHGLASHDCGLVSAEINELDCPHRRWWIRSCRL